MSTLINVTWLVLCLACVILSANAGVRTEELGQEVCLRQPRIICFGSGGPSVRTSTAISLAVFDISKVVENGINEITPEVTLIHYQAQTGTLAATPNPSSVLYTSLCESHGALIQQDVNC
ncbi:hypothetical protein C8R48DRAFT_671921 [Suillus tomentosus]|nr:hypothetical protein C8R48DRAFT_671921 [Suillus tomentosus]